MHNVVNYRITNGTIVRILLWGLLAYFLYFFREFLLTLFVGLVIASTIDPIAKFFSKYKIPRVVTVSSVFIIFCILVVLLVYTIVPKIAEDMAGFLSKLPLFLNDINIFGRNFGIKDVSLYLNDWSKNVSEGQIITLLKNSVIGASGVAETTGNILGGVANVLITFIIGFYLAVQEDGINKFLRLITPKYYESYVLDLWRRSEIKIGSWAKGQIFIAMIISLMVYVTLSVVGIPYASIFALLSFLGELVPMVGLLLSYIPVSIVGYITGGPTTFIIVSIAFFVISHFESYILYPKIMNRVVGVPGIITIIAFILGAKLAGFVGVLVAMPFAAIMMEIVNDILNDKMPSNKNLENKLN